MKEKTSITLSKDLLIAVDRLAGKSSRSAVIERALRAYLRGREQAFIYAHDLKILNEFADVLNAEAEDTLRYQADIWDTESE